MIRASVSYAKNHLSALLNRVKDGETILITDRDRPVAKLMPVVEGDWSSRARELASQGWSDCLSHAPAL